MEYENGEDQILTCKTDNTKILIDILNSLYDSNRKSNVCDVEATVDGAIYCFYLFINDAILSKW